MRHDDERHRIIAAAPHRADAALARLGAAARDRVPRPQHRPGGEGLRVVLPPRDRRGRSCPRGYASRSSRPWPPPGARRRILATTQAAFASSDDIREATGVLGLVLTTFFATAFVTALQRVFRRAWRRPAAPRGGAVLAGSHLAPGPAGLHGRLGAIRGVLHGEVGAVVLSWWRRPSPRACGGSARGSSSSARCVPGCCSPPASSPAS